MKYMMNMIPDILPHIIHNLHMCITKGNINTDKIWVGPIIKFMSDKSQIKILIPLLY